MFSPFAVVGLVALATFGPSTTASSIDPSLLRRGEAPTFPHDLSTTSHCTWWWDNDGSIPCSDMPKKWAITLQEFLRWNPSVTATCTNFNAGNSYCIEAWQEPLPEPTTASPTSSPSPTGSKAPSKPPGLAPQFPHGPNTTSHCTYWWDNDGSIPCLNMPTKWRITLQEFLRWNPSVTDTCTNFNAGNSYCIEAWLEPLPEPTTTSPTSTPSPTTTLIDGTSFPLPPLPTQPGTLAKCNRWHKVVSGNTCASIASGVGIALSQLNFWNKGINIDCSNLWIDTALCTASGELASYWTPLGCYTDSTSRALANRINIPNEATIMSPKVCQDACRVAGYRYAGVEYGEQCWCDNSIKNGHTTAQSGCTTPCPGKPRSHICGGSNRISVYRLDKYEDIGCFTDSGTSRSLKNQITGIGGMTRRICQVSCEKRGYRLSGVESGSQCFCDNTNVGTAASGGCNVPCAGNAGEMCGGSDLINVMRHPTSRSVGCWSDNDSPNMRSLKYQQVIPNAETLMTPDLCRSTCRSMNFLYSGVEYGRDCWCDDKIHSGQAATGCNMPCPGNPSLMCGGGLRLNIYEN